jgi:hypothetical protein
MLNAKVRISVFLHHLKFLKLRKTGITPELEELVQACDGFVIVYDITDKKSFEAVPHYVDLINRNTRRETSPLVVVGYVPLRINNI